MLAVLDRRQEGGDLRVEGQLADRTPDRLVVQSEQLARTDVEEQHQVGGGVGEPMGSTPVSGWRFRPATSRSWTAKRAVLDPSTARFVLISTSADVPPRQLFDDTQ